MTFIIIGSAIVALIIFFFSTYTVIGPNEAHVVIFMGRGRTVKTPVEGGNTSYFYIPFLMKRYIMPLTNVKLDINDIHLNDIKMAPFVCDVVTWLRIQDPIIAAERLSFTSETPFDSLHRDLQAIVQAVARAASMKQEILNIMRDRAEFASVVTKEVDTILEKWGVQLVNLEVNDIRDDGDSRVISNYQSVREAEIDSLARIEVSNRNREAVEKQQENRQKEEVAKANAEKTFFQSQIERDAVVGVKKEEMNQTIAVAKGKANATDVEAFRVRTVGEANVKKEATVVEAEGRGEAIRIQGEKEANVVTLKGAADGNAIEAKGLAEAKAKDAMAEALKKFNDAGISLEKLKALVEIQKAYASAYGLIAENADIKIVTGGDSKTNILGLPMNAESGASLGQMLEAFGGIDAVKKVVDDVKKAVA